MSLTPDRVRLKNQLDPDWSYLLSLNSVNGPVVAQVVFIEAGGEIYVDWGGTKTTLSNNTDTDLEYWYLNMDNSVLGQISSASAMIITGTDISNNSSKNRLSMNRNVSTTALTAQTGTNVSWNWYITPVQLPVGTNTTFRGAPALPKDATAYALFNVVKSPADTYSLAAVYWYLTSSKWTKAPNCVQPAGTNPLSYNNAAPPTVNFYYASSTFTSTPQ